MPYFGTLPDTLLINGTDLQSIAGIVVEDFSGLFAPGRRRGDDIPIPYANGATGVPNLPYEAYTFDIPVVVLESDGSGNTPSTDYGRRAQMIANLRSVATAIGTTGLVTLTRRLANAGGTYDSHTCSARYLDGLGMELLNYHTGRTVLSFLNLDGCWYDGAVAMVP